MKLILAALADYTSITQEGKLNILGIFDTIHSKEFPLHYPNPMQLVLKFEFSATDDDIGKEQICTVVLQDEDGKRILTINGAVTPPNPPPGEILTTQIILDLKGVPFRRPGRYEFAIMIKDKEVWNLPLKVVKASPKKA